MLNLQLRDLSCITAREERMCLISACPNSPHDTCTFQKPESACSFHLLELASNNDLNGLKQVIEEQGAQADVRASWYCRQFGSNKMAFVERSPLMIAALFGSMDVLPYLLDHLAANGGDINRVCGVDKASALLCAMDSGTHNMSDVVQLLLRYGADPALVSPRGPRHTDGKLTGPFCLSATLEKGLLDKCVSSNLESDASDWKGILPDSVSETSFEDLDESLWNLQVKGAPSSCQLSSSSSTWSPKSTGSHGSETRDGFKDRTFEVLSLDVKSSIYSTDEFRMYSFKVRPCSKAYSHDWTECPFAHPGENARRRDPRKFHYSCVPCPDFRKGACRHGDACEYAHGVFESWLHPAQYRTRLCKDGPSCTRKVCFFAHTKEEVRPLLSTEYAGGTYPSPCASPSSLKPSSLLPGSMNLGLPSPSSDISVSGSWTQPGLPTLRLPEGITHASRLRATLGARDTGLDGPSMRDLVSLSAQARINAAVVAASHSAASSPVRDRKPQFFGSNSFSAANYEDVLCSAVSPRSPLQMGMQCSPRATSKFHDTGLGNTALEELIAAMSSPRHSLHPGRSLQGQYDDLGQMGMSMPVSQLGSSSMWGSAGSPSSQLSRAAEVGLLHQGSMASAACLSPAHKEDMTWLEWGSPTGKPEWSVSGDDLTRLRKSNSCKA